MGVMQRISLLAVAVSIALSCAPGGGILRAQTAAAPLPVTGPLAGASITRLGVVVPDIEKTVRKYGEIFGTDAPAIRQETVDLPDGSAVTVKVARLHEPGFQIEIIQPEGKRGPFADYLATYSRGHFSMGLSVRGNVDEIRQTMQQQGGMWTGGKAGGAYAYINFQERLGGTIHVVQEPVPAIPNSLPTQTGIFGGRPLGHVGIATTNIEDTHKAFIEILGVGNLPIGIVPRGVPGPWPYPPNSKYDGSVKLRHVILRMGTVGIELIESLGGPTPWTDAIEKYKGTTFQHIAVGRGKHEYEAWVRMGLKMGALWTNGSIPGRGVVPNSGPFAYLDWTDSLGLVIE
jgi:hypothetical protein